LPIEAGINIMCEFISDPPQYFQVVELHLGDDSERHTHFCTRGEATEGSHRAHYQVFRGFGVDQKGEQ
jgi:hypothetical protein